MMDTAPFKELVRKKAGICFDRAGSDVLSNEIRAMMSEKGLKSSREYYHLILHSPEEFSDFLNLITVNETYFFREPDHLRLFSLKLIPELLGEKAPGEKIRILSAGCSTGEEPYSLAILLREKYGPDSDRLFSICGADIDKRAIQKAREGFYTERAFRMTKASRKASWFNEAGHNRFRVAENISRQVAFRLLNLLSLPFPEAVTQNDIIFYRNVSIYFDAVSRKKIFRNLSEILKPGGYLLVSATETLSHDYGILELIEKDGIFLFRKNRAEENVSGRDRIGEIKQPPPAVTGSFGSCGHMLPHIRKNPQILLPDHSEKNGKTDHPDFRNPDEKKDEAIYEEARMAAQKKAYPKALRLLEQFLLQYPSDIRATVLKAGILLNQGESGAAENICRAAIEKDPLFLEAYFLLGLIAKSADRMEEALKRFKEAIYIRSSAWPPHFYTAQICQSLGEAEKAGREYGIVLNLLDQGGFRDHGLSFFPSSFSEEDIRHLCRYNREKIRNDSRRGY